MSWGDDITQVVYVIGGAIIKCLTAFDLKKIVSLWILFFVERKVKHNWCYFLWAVLVFLCWGTVMGKLMYSILWILKFIQMRWVTYSVSVFWHFSFSIRSISVDQAINFFFWKLNTRSSQDPRTVNTLNDLISDPNTLQHSFVKYILRVKRTVNVAAVCIHMNEFGAATIPCHLWLWLLQPLGWK